MASATRQLEVVPRKGGPTARPIRVCYLIDFLGTGGTESQLLALLRHLDRTRVQPYLCLLDGDSARSRSFEPDDCPVLRLGVRSLHRPHTLRQAARFVRFLRRERIDVLQLYFADSTYFGAVAGRLAGVRRVVGTRFNLGHWMAPWQRWLGRACQRLLDATVANSEACRRAVIADEWAAPGRVTVIENGVELPGEFPEVGRLPRRRAGLLANLRPVKDPETFVRAARLVANAHPDARFLLGGAGELWPALERAVDGLGLRANVSLLGPVADVPGFLADIDVGVLCSRSEGSPNAVLEYMAAGRAVVATAVGGTAQLVRHGVNGLLVPPGDPAALAAAVRELFERPGRAAELAAAARQYARARHDPRRRARRFEDLYARLLGRGPVR